MDSFNSFKDLKNNKGTRFTKNIVKYSISGMKVIEPFSKLNFTLEII